MPQTTYRCCSENDEKHEYMRGQSRSGLSVYLPCLMSCLKQNRWICPAILSPIVGSIKLQMQRTSRELVRNSMRGSPIETPRQTSTTKRMFIDSQEFEQLGQLRRGVEVDVENIKESYHQLRQRELELYAKNINITDEGLRRKFFSTAKDYKVVQVIEPQLVLYNHPKKGLRVITVDQLMTKPGYRPANMEEDIKFDTMEIINELNERLSQKETQDQNPHLP